MRWYLSFFFFLSSKGAVFMFARFFPNDKWLLRNSTLGSWFGWYVLYSNFHVGSDEILLFVIRSISFKNLLKRNEFVFNSYSIFIANIGKWLKTEPLDLMSGVFANGPGERSSILGRVISKTPKMVLDTALLNTQHYKVRIKGKGNEVAPSLTPRCSCYWKGKSSTLG